MATCECETRGDRNSRAIQTRRVSLGRLKENEILENLETGTKNTMASFVTPQNLTLPVSTNAPKATSVALNDGAASASEAFVIKAGLAQNLKGGVWFFYG